MRFAALTLLAIELATLAGCAKKSDDKVYSSPDGTFRVYMPGRPHTQKQEFAGGPSTLYTVDHLSRAYAVGVSEVDVPSGESDDQTEVRLKALCEEQIAQVRGHLTQSKRIALGNYPGLEIEAVLPNDDGVLRGRSFIANNRLYRVLCVASDDSAYSPEAERFFGSFQITAPAAQ